MPDPSIPASEYAARRKALRASLKKSIGVVFAGDQDHDLLSAYRPHPHFEYLTGIVDEPGAALVLDPGSPVEARREMLFLRPLDPEVERWDGYRLQIGEDLRRRTGVKAVFRTSLMPRFLTEAVRRHPSLACLHPLAHYDQPVSPDLALFRRISARMPATEILDHTDLVPRMRSVKSPREIAVIRKAVDITRLGFEEAVSSIRAGMSEFDVQRSLEHAYRIRGSRGPAFPTIVGGGLNSTVLHYQANAATLEAGDLVCIDSGASFAGYGADITRTVPVSGTFSPRQREVYEVVLRALGAAVKAVRPGATFAQIDRSARAVISRAGHADHFIHGIGHHLGLETHDATPPGPLREVAVITIEPGIYIPDEKIGVRIEDDVLVTREGGQVLSAKIPKTASAIEKLIGG